MTSARKLPIAALIAVIASWISAPVASAGGSTFESDRERYEPGDDVTLVGDTGGGAYGWIEDGPFFGYLERLGPDDLPIEGSRLHVGQMEVTETGKGGWQTLRVTSRFTLPPNLTPGVYLFDYCNANCSERLGDLTHGIVYVGVDPPDISEEVAATPPPPSTTVVTRAPTTTTTLAEPTQALAITIPDDDGVSSRVIVATAVAGGAAFAACGVLVLRRRRARHW